MPGECCENMREDWGFHSRDCDNYDGAPDHYVFDVPSVPDARGEHDPSL